MPNCITLGPAVKAQLSEKTCIMAIHRVQCNWSRVCTGQ